MLSESPVRKMGEDQGFIDYLLSGKKWVPLAKTCHADGGVDKADLSSFIDEMRNKAGDANRFMYNVLMSG